MPADCYVFLSPVKYVSIGGSCTCCAKMFKVFDDVEMFLKCTGRTAAARDRAGHARHHLRRIGLRLSQPHGLRCPNYVRLMHSRQRVEAGGSVSLTLPPRDGSERPSESDVIAPAELEHFKC